LYLEVFGDFPGGGCVDRTGPFRNAEKKGSVFGGETGSKQNQMAWSRPRLWSGKDTSSVTREGGKRRDPPWLRGTTLVIGYRGPLDQGVNRKAKNMGGKQAKNSHTGR